MEDNMNEEDATLVKPFDEDAAANEYDATVIEETDKTGSEEDGPQPSEIPAWNDDNGELVVL